MSMTPYVVGQWVRGDSFYGRDDLIRDILHGNRNCWVRLGTRLIGKTSTLKELERAFGDRFLRVHRNALVARAHIVRLQRGVDGSWEVLLDGVKERPVVSRRHLAETKRRLLSD